MISVFHKICSVLLAMLVMLSTLTLTVEKHFCGDTLVDASVFTELKRCGMESLDSQDSALSSCCKDTADIVEGQDELQHAKFDFGDLDKEPFTTVFLISEFALPTGIFEPELLLDDYSPPDIVRDINTLQEVFLI